jgi:alkylation response protein AidB-like acyl-CoA dehydrogenase
MRVCAVADPGLQGKTRVHAARMMRAVLEEIRGASQTSDEEPIPEPLPSTKIRATKWFTERLGNRVGRIAVGCHGG